MHDRDVGRRDSFAPRHNTELTAERDEALAQSAAMAEVLQVINAASGDLAPVFDAILAHAMRLCEAAFGMFNTYDGERFNTAAVRGVPEPYAKFRHSSPPAYAPGTSPARLLAGEKFVHVLDMKAEEIYRRGDPNRRAIVDLGGARTVLAVPLLKDAGVVGMFAIYRQEVRPFTERQIALLQSFAAPGRHRDRRARACSTKPGTRWSADGHRRNPESDRQLRPTTCSRCSRRSRPAPTG